MPRDDPQGRLFAADIVGHLCGYAQLTNTRALALVGDPDATAYELLFSFSSPQEKKEFLNLVRSNEDMGNDYITEFTQPSTEEIRNARTGNGLAAGCPHPCDAHCGDLVVLVPKMIVVRPNAARFVLSEAFGNDLRNSATVCVPHHEPGGVSLRPPRKRVKNSNANENKQLISPSIAQNDVYAANFAPFLHCL